MGSGPDGVHHRPARRIGEGSLVRRGSGPDAAAGSGSSMGFIINALIAAIFFAPMICYPMFMSWENIFLCFVPKKLLWEIVCNCLCLIYVCWIIGPVTQFDEITLLVLSITTSFIWIFVYMYHNAHTFDRPRLRMLCVPVVFTIVMAGYFWTIQSGLRVEYRRTFGIPALGLVTILPTLSVVNRLRHRVPDEPPIPNRIKMGLSFLNAITSAYGVWIQHAGGYHKNDNLWFLFMISCVSTGFACLQTVVRFVGPLWVSDMVRHAWTCLCRKLKELLNWFFGLLWVLGYHRGQ